METCTFRKWLVHVYCHKRQQHKLKNYIDNNSIYIICRQYANKLLSYEIDKSKPKDGIWYQKNGFQDIDTLCHKTEIY